MAPPKTEYRMRYAGYGILILVLMGLTLACGFVGLSRYRSHRFARMCVTGNETLLKNSGYQLCAFPAPVGSTWYCDPRQLPLPSEITDADRCELKQDGRSLIVSFRPGVS